MVPFGLLPEALDKTSGRNLRKTRNIVDMFLGIKVRSRISSPPL